MKETAKGNSAKVWVLSARSLPSNFGRVTRLTYSLPLPLPFLESVFPPSLPYLKPSLIIHISVNVFNIYDIMVQRWQWLTHTSTTIVLFLWRIYLTASLTQMQSIIDFIPNNRPMSGDRSSASRLEVLQISIFFISYLIGGCRTSTHVNVIIPRQWAENINQFSLAKFILLLPNPFMQPIRMNYPRYRICNLKSNKLLDLKTNFQQITMSSIGTFCIAAGMVTIFWIDELSRCL